MKFNWWSLQLYRRERGKKQQTWRVFSLKELHAATNNFNYDNKLGEGGFGSVYWGQLWDGSQVMMTFTCFDSNIYFAQYISNLASLLFTVCANDFFGMDNIDGYHCRYKLIHIENKSVEVLVSIDLTLGFVYVNINIILLCSDATSFF